MRAGSARRASLLLLALLLAAGCAAAGGGTASPETSAPRTELEEPAASGSLPAALGSDASPAEEADDWLVDEEATFHDPADRDPIEPVNRGLFGFNEAVYRWVLNPVSLAYSLIVPGAGRRAIWRFFSNLGEPVVLVNHLMQLAPRDAGATGARFLINTTAGLVGLFDPATAWGLPGRRTDFGQTLAVYSVGSGPYLVIPILGPSSMRDAAGELVDGLLRPDVWLLGAGPVFAIALGGGLATYDVERERLDALRETSVDFYSALRGAYLLDRDASVEARILELRRPSGSP